MSYRSYVGGPLTGYTNEAYGYPQTYMANDILALQTLYGANYTTHSENTVYSWNPTHRAGIHQRRRRSPRRAAAPAVRPTASLRRSGTATASIPMICRTTRRAVIDQSQPRRIVDHLDRAARLSRQRPLCAGQRLQRLSVQQRCALLYRQRHRRLRQRQHRRQRDRQYAERRRRQRHADRRRRQRHVIGGPASISLSGGERRRQFVFATATARPPSASTTSSSISPPATRSTFRDRFRCRAERIPLSRHGGLRRHSRRDQLRLQ